jgi:ABC-2 type transport system ATP-binding protein
MKPPVAQFESVRKIYRRGLFRRRAVQALRGVSLTVPAGCVFGLLGPNRAGKTTLVKLLLSICRPTSGTVRRLDRPNSDRRTLARVGYLHESQAFPRYLTATGLLQYYGALSHIPSAELRTRIPALLDEVGLADRTCEPIAGFSKGMVQRLALAQSIVNDPDLLVLDEPTEGLDLSARQLLHEVLERRQRRGKTAILVSHSLADVERICDRLAVIRHGELAFNGTLDELTHDQTTDTSCPLEDALQPLYEMAGA